MSEIKKMYIRGEWVEAESGETLEVFNPATGECVGVVSYGDERDAKKAIDAAHEAFRDWSRLPGRQRSKYLTKLYELVMKHRNELAELMSAEMGKPFGEAKFEAVGSADNFLWYAEEAKRIYGETIPSYDGSKRLMAIKQPVGVVAAITPWNFPVNMVARKIAPALAAGCTVVLKPAMESPLSAVRLFELMEEAGFPKGVVNLVLAKAEKFGDEVLQNRKVAKITFTGSTAVGKHLMEGAAKQVKRISMELGGHAPFIVFEDADLDAAVAGFFESKFRNSGQMCISTNRLYVHESVVDAFTEKLVARLKKTKVGDGRQKGVEIGPLVDEEALNGVMEHIRDAKEKGGRVIFGGNRLTEGEYSKGFFLEPTVITHVTPDMKITYEETFGPVVPIIPFKEEEAVLEMANDTRYGLAAYCYTKDNSRCFRVAEALEYGIIGVNDGTPTQTQAPFGGLKESGLGREGGRYAMESFLETKFISMSI
ncbi:MULTISPECIES: NAD-dependent succinate-semialdehyde dehydrogenase [Thermoactinomyces]|jgi:succinate-semialdehyde dehydrogenase / glutarate-semialdehyde dehydrogenase|uniref:NAD-dependent succinate-semialdehyde dehydrogenase n=1 Tax=Thermoactinomyces vulgaris TaxID=2026 RepID=A0ABS0QH03_THEVU|nr:MULTISPECIES: NAD-dependent succinate-semialdehyde dehydrogenase [Thermoactinomyces]KFZ40364.1 succinate-semialdehyde dehydrogenase [Thermoactinomyces sp. Gus2-1]KYQ86692.1 NAD-dependent succinate-semialdehyde dehydrogenase [Thermoactinomyces sp. AS95]MBA4550780.1 NAD-dependent succinate-semialdehyde dehydrogenase [Thermoactinomyces vulgaris]MBA4596161.1 NAD-dependent succinate-semialdehyde dehydrogenase [Thermoactinomyces vulgaris]MBH8585895.1 NAD-dependent succinate-semialdehyde dehydroge